MTATVSPFQRLSGVGWSTGRDDAVWCLIRREGSGAFNTNQINIYWGSPPTPEHITLLSDFVRPYPSAPYSGIDFVSVYDNATLLFSIHGLIDSVGSYSPPCAELQDAEYVFIVLANKGQYPAYSTIWGSTEATHVLIERGQTGLIDRYELTRRTECESSDPEYRYYSIEMTTNHPY